MKYTFGVRVRLMRRRLNTDVGRDNRAVGVHDSSTEFGVGGRRRDLTATSRRDNTGKQRGKVRTHGRRFHGNHGEGVGAFFK
jgi:hypothetical protein